MDSAVKWKLLFGFSLLTLLAVIACLIALGHVEEKTSFGLVQVLTILGVLGGGFANWAFGQKDKAD
jgi:hypothetical protein